MRFVYSYSSATACCLLPAAFAAYVSWYVFISVLLIRVFLAFFFVIYFDCTIYKILSIYVIYFIGCLSVSLFVSLRLFRFDKQPFFGFVFWIPSVQFCVMMFRSCSGGFRWFFVFVFFLGLSKFLGNRSS